MGTVTATLEDEFGNVVVENLPLEKSPQPSFFTIDNPLMEDDIVSAIESTNVIVSGTTLPNYLVTVAVLSPTGQVLTATTTSDADGLYDTAFDLSTFDDGTVLVNATVSNDRETSVAGHTLHKDTAVLFTTLDTPIAGDNVVNFYEQDAVLISGQGEPGSWIEVQMGDGSLVPNQYALVNSEGDWESLFDLSTLPNGPLTVTAMEFDLAGNEGLPLTADITLATTLPVVTLAPLIAGDDLINSFEQKAVLLSGTSSGSLGDEIVLQVSDGIVTLLLTAPVQEDGSWEITMDASALQDGPLSVSSSLTDAAGNQSEDGRDILKSAVILTVSIDDPLAGDNLISNAEIDSLLVTGQGDVGLSVLVNMINSDGLVVDTETATVGADGRWELEFTTQRFLEGEYELFALETDSSGNSVNTTHIVRIDLRSRNLSLHQPISGDGLIDATDNDGLVLSGTGEPGSQVTVVLRSGGESVEVVAQVSPAGIWFAVADVSSLPDGTVTVQTSQVDPAGNLATLSQTSVPLDTNPLRITINSPVSDDDIIDAFEDELPVIIQGTSVPGATVRVRVFDRDGNSLSSSPVEVHANGNWIVSLQGVDQLAHGPLSITATSTRGDVEASTSHPAYHDTIIPSPIQIDTPIEDEGVINGEEDEAVLLTGSAPAGVTLTVSVSDGISTVSTQLVVPSSGRWSTVMDVSDLNEGLLTVRASTPDGGSDSELVQHVVLGPIVTIDRPISQDNVVDISDDYHMELTGRAPPNALVNLEIVDNAGEVVRASVTASPEGLYTALVNIISLNNGVLTIHAQATDENGNVGRDSALVLQSPFGELSGCDALPAPQCGNGICDPAESVSICSEDCQLDQCGDGACGPHENQESCPADCTSCEELVRCGDGVCQPEENVGSCRQDCDFEPPCGNGVCDPEENAGSCPSECSLSPPNCGNGQCDADENKGNCPDDCSGDNPSSCRNGQCNVNENAGNCPEDCAPRTLCNLDGRCDLWEDHGECGDCDGSCNLDDFCDLAEGPITCPDCEGLSQVSIRTFLDTNLNGIFDETEQEINGIFFYLDFNMNHQLDMVEPIFSTSAEGGIRLPLRAGDYRIRLLDSSMQDLVLGMLSEAFVDYLDLKVNDSGAQTAFLDLPLSRNLRPHAENFMLQVSSESASVDVPHIITLDSDPNRNIHLTKGFEMLRFPNDLASWSFHNGTLTISPLQSQ